MSRYLIAIDDTDNLTSRGTGFRARTLAALLEAEGLGRSEGVTRHQLLVDPRVRYTSHNSALCLRVDTDPGRSDPLLAFACDFLRRESAPGSDAGVCLAPAEQVGASVRAFGRRAQREVIDREEAQALARREGLELHGLTGDHGGVIGALAAVGLHAEGTDGRFVWLPGLRELEGALSAGALHAAARIDRVRTLEGEEVAGAARVALGPWPRPVLIDGEAVLLVEHNQEDPDDAEWRVIPKERIKQF